MIKSDIDMNDCVVITGAGAVSSLGNSVSEIWDDLLNGKSGIRPIESFDAEGFDCKVAAQADCLDPADMGIHPRDARIMDKHSLMLMKCSQDAFNQAQAGHTIDQTGRYRILCRYGHG